MNSVLLLQFQALAGSLLHCNGIERQTHASKVKMSTVKKEFTKNYCTFLLSSTINSNMYMI